MIREAVAQYASDRRSAQVQEASAFDRLKPFAGIVRTGGANYSKNTHAKYRACCGGGIVADVLVDASALVRPR